MLRSMMMMMMIALVALFPSEAQAQHKLALVIGNGTYGTDKSGWHALDNALNDTDLIAQKLALVGYGVTIVKDGSWAEIDRKIDTFSSRITENDTVIFYYAGHGFEYNRRNYLVPIGAPEQTDIKNLGDNFIDFEKLANRLANARTSIFVLDACRTAVPFVKVTLGDAMAAGEASAFDDFDFAPGTNYVVLFSTARGVPAQDAAPPPDNYSPFAWEFSKYAVVPRVPIMGMFQTVTNGVYQRTLNSSPPQVPSAYSSIHSDIYVNDGLALDVPVTPQATPLAISDRDLATVDETVLITRTLATRTIKDIQTLADRNDGQATYLLGYMYEFGIGVPKNLERSRAMLERSAEIGTPSGLLELAYFIHHNSDKSDEKFRALELYRLASDTGFAKAQAHYGSLFLLGNLAPKDVGKGLSLMRLAARGGYPYAAYVVAEWGTPDERKLWLTYLEGLAEKGDPEGDHWLCQHHIDSNAPSKALAYCQRSANLGYADSQAQMAQFYADGKVVLKSEDEAIRWARRALSRSDLEPGAKAKMLSIKSSYSQH